MEDGCRRRVWVAEDDEEMRRMIVLILRRAGLQVVDLADGGQLMDQIRGLDAGQRVPDLIITDHHMPATHGLDALDYLKGRHPEVPVIVISGFADPETRARAERLRVVAVLDKPFDLYHLRDLALGSLAPAHP